MTFAKPLIAGAVLALLFVALAQSESRVAGEVVGNEVGTFENEFGTEGQVTETPPAIRTESNEPAVSAASNSNVSTSVSEQGVSERSFSLDTSVDISVSSEVAGENAASPESGAPQSSVNFSINGQEIPCAPDQRYRSPDRSVRCANDGDDIKLRVRGNTSGGSYNFKFKISQ